MSFFSERRIGLKALVPYVIALLFVIGIGILAIVRLNQISNAVDVVTNQLAAEEELADQIVSQALLIRFYANRYVRTQLQADLDQFEAAFDQLEALLDEADPFITDPERRALLGRIASAVDQYGTTFRQVADLIEERLDVRAEVLDVQSLILENRLTALRVHVASLEQPDAFLSLSNAQVAFQRMRFSANQYLETGDDRQVVLFRSRHQDLQAALGSLEGSLQDPVQLQNLADALAASNTYEEGFENLREGQIRLRALFSTELDQLEPEISRTASQISDSVKRELEQQNASSQTLIFQTRLMLLATTGIAVLAGLGLGVVLYRYLAEREQAELALRQARDELEVRVKERTAELEQANEEIKQFAYIVSHDLRAPLVNLKGFAAELGYSLDEIRSTIDGVKPHLDENAQKTLEWALEEDVPEALSFIESSVDRMDSFINSVLKLSRLGRRELQPEPLDMVQLVEVILDSLSHQIEKHQIQITVGDLPTVVADRTSMEQIVGNLVSNAIKYRKPDQPGEVAITAEHVAPSGAAGDGQIGVQEVVFHVQDNGRGIAAEDHHKVFAPFRRAGRQDVPGEGMGLAYVQTLVRRLGGRIWFESELGAGTTFHFTIATAEEPEISH